MLAKWLAIAFLALMATSCSANGPQAQPAATRDQFLQQQLSALEQLARPEGVKAQLGTSVHVSSSAPIGAGAKTRLQYDLHDACFCWRYCNPGDYDQNGEVNISDLTPLAV